MQNILFVLGDFIGVLIIALFFILNSPQFQTFLAKKATQFIQTEAGVQCNIKSIKIYPFSRLEINQFFLEDKSHDTLIYFNQLRGDIEEYNLFTNYFYFDDVELDDFQMYLKKTAEGETNISFLKELFKSKKKNKKKPNIVFQDVKLNNAKFKFKNLPKYEEKDFGMNYSDIDVQNIQAYIKKGKFDKDGLVAQITSLKAKEKTGVNLLYLRTVFKLNDHEMSFNKAHLYSNAGRLKGDVVFSYSSMKSMAYFSDSVQMNINIIEAKSNVQNVAFFAPILKGFNQFIILKGKVHGKVDHLKSDSLLVLWDGGVTDLNFDFKHLHLKNKRKFDIILSNFRSTVGSVKSFPMFPFEEGKKIPFPETIPNEEKIRFNGRLTGDERKLRIDGVMDNESNYIQTDIVVKNDSLYTDVTGTVDYKSIYLKYFIPKTFNKTYSQGNMAFQWHKSKINEQTQLFIDMKNDQLRINDADIKDLNAQFTWNGSVWDGKISQLDDFQNINLILRYESKKDKKLRLEGGIADLELAKLLPNYYHKGEKVAFNGVINLDLNNKNDLKGKVKLYELTLENDEGIYPYGSISFSSFYKDLNHDLSLNSKALDLNVSGAFEMNKLFKIIPELYQLLIPQRSTKDFDWNNENVVLKLNLKNWFLIQLLVPQELPDVPNVNLIAKLNQNEVLMDAHFNKFTWSKQSFDNVFIHFDKKEHNGLIHLTIDTLKNDLIALNKIDYQGVLNKDFVKNNLIWKNPKKTFGDLHFNLIYNSFNAIQMDWDQSTLALSDDTLQIFNNASVFIDSTSFNFERFELRSNTSAIALNGAIHKYDPNQNVNVRIANFDIQELYPLYSNKIEQRFQGIFDGSLNINHPNTTDSLKRIDGSLKIKDFKLDELTIGNLDLNTKWNAQNSKLELRGDMDQEYLKNITFDGFYSFKDAEPLDMDISLNKTNFDFLNAFLPEIIEDFGAKAVGTVKLSGSFKEPKLNGKVFVEEGEIKLSQLNTKYTFSDYIQINTHNISWENMKIKDEEGNMCTSDAQIKHHYFRDWEVNLGLNTSNLLVMDNNAKISPDYYGKLYLMGQGTYHYDSTINKLEFEGKTMKGSKFILPFEDEVLDEESGFINFVNKDTSQLNELSRQEQYEAANFDFEMDVKLELTPDAKFELVFDDKVGEKIQGRAKGDIQLKLEKNGDFDMFGKAYIASGFYLFSFQNIINKKFDLEPGGEIKFDGDISTGEIDVKANYKVRANLRDLSPVVINSNNNLIDNSFKNSAEVNCGILLKRKLLNPDIDFKITFVNENSVPDEVKTALVNITSTEQERNLQFFSLLLMNRFWPKLSVDNSANNLIGNTSSELLSNQVSNWLSSISDEVDFNFKYKPNDTYGNSELAFGFETQVLNDRLIIKGTAGVANRNSGTNNEINRNLIGDFIIEYKLSENGNFRVKAFNLTNDYTVSTIDNSLYTQGIGVNYSEDFDRLNDVKFIQMFKNWFARRPDDVEKTTSE